TGRFQGTAAYMAPEQAVDAKSVGPEADVFALGAIVFECLAGRPAFEADSVVELLAQIQSARAPSLLAVNPAVPPSVARVVERALARDPAARFPTGTALARALATASPEPRRRLGIVVVATIVLASGATAWFTRAPRK